MPLTHLGCLTGAAQVPVVIKLFVGAGARQKDALFGLMPELADCCLQRQLL
jgi:hypothetical protein